MNTLSYPIGPFEMPDQVTTEDIQQYIQQITDLPGQLKVTVKELDDEQLNMPYRPEGWTVRQVIHHVPDSQINGYIRFQWTLTENTPTIKAYNEQAWATLEYQNQVPPEVSLDILEMIHARWVYLLRSLSEEDWDRVFIHPEDNNKYTLKDALALYAWHGKHHLAHITTLKERMGW